MGAASLYVEVERVCMLSEEQYFSEEKRYHGSSFIVRLIETRFKKELSLLQMSIVKAISLSVMVSSILVGISFLFEHGEDVVLNEYLLRWLSYIALGFFAHFVLNALPMYVPFLRSSKIPIMLFFIIAMAALGFSLVKINSITLFNSAVSNKDQGIEERKCLDSEGDVQTCNQLDIVIQDEGVVDVTNNMSMHEASLGPDIYLGKTASDVAKMSLKELSDYIGEATNGSVNIENRVNLLLTSFKESLNGAKVVSIENAEDLREFLVKLDEMMFEDPAKADIYLAHGLREDIPFSSVVDLINKGVNLNGLHLTILATKINVEQIKQLENYGVDISATTRSGNNMLVKSIYNRKSSDVFDYLLQHDALVFPENTDVLKEVLERSAWLDRDISYVEKLINRGVKVSAETKKWAEKDLKDINEEYYASIKHLLI
jgi:hypothetical protein